VAVLACAALMTACSTVTVNPSGTGMRAGNPSWSDQKSYFWWGLAGEETIYVTRVCRGRKAVETQAQTTFGDALLSGLTLGIWAPRHAKVWCE
jgi:hypothetical protein